jgi:hypothetical protein
MATAFNAPANVWSFQCTFFVFSFHDMTANCASGHGHPSPLTHPTGTHGRAATGKHEPERETLRPVPRGFSSPIHPTLVSLTAMPGSRPSPPLSPFHIHPSKRRHSLSCRIASPNLKPTHTQTHTQTHTHREIIQIVRRWQLRNAVVWIRSELITSKRQLWGKGDSLKPWG